MLHKDRSSRPLLHECSGSVGIMFGLALVPLVGLGGGAVDYLRAHQQRTDAWTALDSAVLAAAKDLSLSDADRRQLLERTFRANAGLGDYVLTSSWDGRTLTGSVSATVPTAFLRLVGIDEFPLNVTSAASTSAGGMELVMVLDVSGSMGGGGKIEALREASIAIVDKIYGDAETRPDTWIGIVPFSGRVNIADYGAGWMSSSQAGGQNGRQKTNNAKNRNTGQTDAKLCTGQRSDPNQVNDAPPSVELFPVFTGNPSVCPGPEAIALSSSKTVIRDALAALYTGHGTSTQVGMAWGYRMISPEWKGLWGDAALPLSRQESPGKYVIVMTDGKNHPNQSGDRFSEEEANEMLLRTCSLMKRDGITIFSVAFDMGGSLTELYQNCASGPENHFDAESGAELLQAFNDIGTRINEGTLRLMR